jgi:hypothetical protein
VGQALKATDLLLQSGGFSAVIVDLGDAEGGVARRVPLTSWFRFRRTVEGTATALVVLEHAPSAIACATAVLQLRRADDRWTQAADSSRGVRLRERWKPRTLTSMCFQAELLRLRDHDEPPQRTPELRQSAAQATAYARWHHAIV